MKSLLALFEQLTHPTLPAEAYTLDLPPCSALHRSTLTYYYNTSIRLRAKNIDLKAGIQSHFFKSADDRPCWWRQGAAVEFQACNPTDSYFTEVNLARLFYAYLMAAVVIDLMQSTPKEDCIYDILLLEIQWKEGECTASEAKTLLIELLSKHHPTLDTQLLNLMLDETKNWVGMLSKAATLVTDIQLNAGRCLITETPKTELTPAEKALFQDIHHQAWYIAQPALVQKLILFFLPALTDGLHVIPSQLRHIIPLNRNAYRTAIYASETGAPLKKINQFYHSGTVAYLGDHPYPLALQITKNNLEQQAALSHADHHVMICLNSRLADHVVGPIESWVKWNRYTYDDSQILSLNQAAASDTVHYAKLCLNGFRHFEWNDYTGINALLQLIKAHPAFINHPDIEKINHYQSLWAITDRDVKSLKILYHLTKLLYDYHRALKTEPAHYPRCHAWFGCASGENRTGIAIYDLIAETLNDFFHNGLNFYQLIARSQHIHFITGNQGNTFGTEGIREKSSLSFKPLHASTDLITHASDQKHIPATSLSQGLRAKFTLFYQKAHEKPMEMSVPTPL